MSARAHSIRGGEFADWFRTLLPETVRLTKDWRAAWARCFDDMVRLDVRTEAQIAAVCGWARSHDFWRRNFFTPLKLREKNAKGAGGLLYFDVFAEQMAADRGAVPSLPMKVLNALEDCHRAFCAAAKREEPFRLHAAAWHRLLCSPEYAVEDGHSDPAAGRLAADVRHVAWYLGRGIAQGARNPGALKLALFLAPARFFADLAEARKHGKAFFQTDGGKRAGALYAPRTVVALPLQNEDERERIRAGAKMQAAELFKKLGGGDGR